MLQRVRMSGALAASVQRAIMPQAAAAVMALPSPATAAVCARHVRTLFTRSALQAPKSSKGRKGKDTEEVAESESAAPTLDSAAAAAAAPAAASAPRKGAKKSATAPIVHDFEEEARQIREHALLGKSSAKLTDSGEIVHDDAPLITRAAPHKKKHNVQPKEPVAAVPSRRDQMSVASVIEKEVPLMDLTGLTPGQNKFADVLELLREQNYPEEVIHDLEQVGDLATGSTAEILSGKLKNLRAKYGRMPHDTGSPEVQVAMLTERLKGYERHQQVHRSDIANRRNFLAVWHRRRKLLKYLRRTRYETYAYMMRELQLRETDIDNYGLDRKSATQAPRIKRD